MRISNSFSEGEIQVLDFILSTLLRGGAPHMAVRSKDFASLCRKVHAMKSRVSELKDSASHRSGSDKSSVGVMDATAATSVGVEGARLRQVG